MAQVPKKRKVDHEINNESAQLMTSATIDTLSNSILSRIFSYLPSVEKIRLETVCKRWQAIDKALWSSADLLSFYAVESRKSPLIDDNINSRIILKTTQPKIYRKVLSMCGPNISHLSLSDKIDVINASIVSTIAEFCQNLTHLRINHVFNPYTAGLSQLLSVNRNIKLFTINDFQDYNQLARCLRHLSMHTLRELKIKSGQKQENIEDFIASLNTLLEKTSLVSLNIDRGDEKTIETISEHQELQLLSLRRFETPFDVEFIGIGKLRNLIHLDLSYCRRYVTNELITNVVENSKNLRMLDLNECTQIRLAGLVAICSLKKLKKLQLSGIDTVDDYILGLIPMSVETLGLSVCSITDDGAQPFIRKHSNLQDLDIRFCAITNQTLEVAVQVTKKRVNNKVLTISYTHDDVFDVLPFNCDDSPLLKLIPSSG